MKNELLDILKTKLHSFEQWDRQVAVEWYGYGLLVGDDFFLKFMMHWIAFNWLYNECTDEFEWERIQSFCNNKKQYLEMYDAFSTAEYKTLISSEKVEIGQNSGKIKRYINNAYDKLMTTNDIPSLFLILYQIRCNLFHGSKSIRCDRDIKLVRISSVLLEGYLKALFENYPEFQEKYKLISEAEILHK